MLGGHVEPRLLVLSLLLACHGGADDGDPTVPYVTDTAAVNPPDTPPEDPVFDADHVLLVSAIGAIHVLGADGDELDQWDLATYVTDPACGGQCRAEGLTPDGDGMVLNWAQQDGMETVGGLVRMDPVDGALGVTWAMGGWVYPHEVVRDPSGPNFLVADAMLDGVFWVPDDGSGRADAPVARIDEDTEGVDDAHTPNGLALYRDGDRSFLVVSYRGNDAGTPASEVGRLLCFDVTDRADPRFLWKFPAEGNLQAPHNPSFHWRDGRWVLLYAHSHGDRGQAGSIGVAQTVDLARAPTYIADLRPDSGEWGFPRGVALTGDDQLIITDTSTDRGLGAVYLADFPTELRPGGESGAFHVDGVDQHFETVETTTFAIGFEQAYRAFLWAPTF